MRYFVPVLLFAFAVFGDEAFAQQGTAPFCRVDNAGTQFQCYYYSMDSCRAAAGANGTCVVNQQSQNQTRYDFTTGADVLSEAQRWQSPPPAGGSLTSQQQRWLRMCDRMEQSYFEDLESIRSRFSPPMTAEEYARAATSFRQRAEYCRSLAR